MTAYTSQKTGVLSDRTVWSPDPGAGNYPGMTAANADVITVANGHVVTVDSNAILGSKASNVGCGFTLNGASVGSYGKLIVATGVTLTVRGTDSSSNRQFLVNQFGVLQLNPGSTLLGDCASDWQSTGKVLGNIVAQGTSGSRITFSVPPANISWAKQVTLKTVSGTSIGYMDYNRSLRSYPLYDATNVGAISNAAHTGLGSMADSSWASDAASDSDHGVRICSIPETSLANLIASIDAGTPYGHYYLDHQSGFLYFYCTISTPTLKWTAYRLDTATANWHGWGIFGGSSSGSSFLFDYCDFTFMGTPGAGFAAGPNANHDQVPIWAASLPAGGASVTNSTFTYCYGALGFDSCTGSVGSPVLVQNNTFNFHGVLSFVDSVICVSGNTTYLNVDSNTLNTNGPFVYFVNGYGVANANSQDAANASITNNSGVCFGTFISGPATPAIPWGATTSALQFATSDALVSGNDICGGGAVFDGRIFGGCFGGTAGHPAIVTNNHFHHCNRAGALGGSYLQITKNRWGHCYHHGFTGSIQSYTYATDITIANNLYYGIRGGAGPEGGAFVMTGYNHNTVLNNLVVANNTLDGGVYGLFDIGDSEDLVSEHHLINASVVNNCINYSGWAFQRDREGETTASNTGANSKNRAHILECDYNSVYNLASGYGKASSYGSALVNRICATGFYLGASKYNRLTSSGRNIPGVALFDASYTTAQAGRNLVYTVNSLGVDHTLAWGGGTPVQLIFDSGTAAGGGRRTIGCAGKSTWGMANTGRWDLKENWLWVVSGTNAGMASTIVGSTYNTVVTVAKNAGGSGWVVGNHATLNGGTLDLYGAVFRVTAVNAGAVTGLEIVSGGGYANGGTPGTTALACTRVEGSTGTGLTVNVTWAPGLLFTPDFATPCDNTSVFAIVHSEVQLNDGSGGTVQAGTLLGAGSTLSLPTTTQTDTGITVAVNHTQTGNPLWANAGSVASSSAADHMITAGSACIDTGTSDNAASTDYFGTSRPTGAGYDIGFGELASPAATSYTVSGPSSGTVNVDSDLFTLSPVGGAWPVGQSIAIASDGAGTFSPVSPLFPTGFAPVTFRYHPTSATGSPHHISFTATPALGTDPTALAYTVVPVPVAVYPAITDVWFGTAVYGPTGTEYIPAKRASSIANCTAANILNGVTIDNVVGNLPDDDTLAAAVWDDTIATNRTLTG